MNDLDLQWYCELEVVPPFSHKKVNRATECSPHVETVFGEMVVICRMNYLVDMLLPPSLSSPALFCFLCLSYEKQTF